MTAYLKNSVNNRFFKSKWQLCESGMLIPDPVFSILDPGSWIPDPTTKKRETFSLSYLFLVAKKFHKIMNYFILYRYTQNQRIFYPKIAKKTLRNMGRGSRIRQNLIPCPASGFRGQKSTGSEIRNTAKWRKYFNFLNYFQERLTCPEQRRPREL
jgi:hypothetical protein